MGEEAERVYRVDGMTCVHCRTAVIEGVGGLPGVSAVEVDLETGRVAVRGESIDDGEVAAAVLGAGYEVRP